MSTEARAPITVHVCNTARAILVYLELPECYTIKNVTMFNCRYQCSNQNKANFNKNFCTIICCSTSPDTRYAVLQQSNAESHCWQRCGWLFFGLYTARPMDATTRCCRCGRAATQQQQQQQQANGRMSHDDDDYDDVDSADRLRVRARLLAGVTLKCHFHEKSAR